MVQLHKGDLFHPINVLLLAYNYMNYHGFLHPIIKEKLRHYFLRSSHLSYNEDSDSLH